MVIFHLFDIACQFLFISFFFVMNIFLYVSLKYGAKSCAFPLFLSNSSLSFGRKKNKPIKTK